MTSSNSTNPGQRRGAPAKRGVVAAARAAWAAAVADDGGGPDPPALAATAARSPAAAAAMAATGVDAQRSEEKRSPRETDTVMTAPPGPGAARFRKMERTASPGEAFRKPTLPDQAAGGGGGGGGRRRRRRARALPGQPPRPRPPPSGPQPRRPRPRPRRPGPGGAGREAGPGRRRRRRRTCRIRPVSEKRAFSPAHPLMREVGGWESARACAAPPSLSPSAQPASSGDLLRTTLYHPRSPTCSPKPRKRAAAAARGPTRPVSWRPRRAGRVDGGGGGRGSGLACAPPPLAVFRLAPSHASSTGWSGWTRR